MEEVGVEREDFPQLLSSVLHGSAEQPYRELLRLVITLWVAERADARVRSITADEYTALGGRAIIKVCSYGGTGSLK